MATRDLFSSTLSELQRWQGGQAVSAQHLNQVVDVVDDMRTGLPSPRQVSHPPRGKAATEDEAGTRTRFCKIVDPLEDIEPPFPIADHQNLVVIQFVTGAGTPEFSPTQAWTWPARTYAHYKMFVRKDDVFLALYMNDAWYVRWDVRFMPVPVPSGIQTGDCSA